MHCMVTNNTALVLLLEVKRRWTLAGLQNKQLWGAFASSWILKLIQILGATLNICSALES